MAMNNGTRNASQRIMPLKELIDYKENAYELCAAVSTRAYQLAILKTPEVEKNFGKVVSLACQELFEKRVDYKFITD
ncbi:MAG: DNA-directed RNA polymerase subunit omega [Spirochaetales bacterium]|nr:DNA-directed RNA polymerase subunit omega [Spirochaetales bacterium]